VDHISGILSVLSTVAQAASSSLTLYHSLAGYLRDRTRRKKSSEVLRFLAELGACSEQQVRGLVDRWRPPTPVAPQVREELATLLTNLVRGARFHSTHGTPLSAYLKCDSLVEQLLANIQPKLKTGTVVANDWRLAEFLGMGSFAEVWVGRNPRHPEPRAFKFFTRPDAGDWFQREGEALYAVQDKLRDCPNVIRYVDVALAGPPCPYLVLEYVAGGSLEGWLTSPPADRAPLDVGEVVGGLARGLARAHRDGIYHRDLKPANVLLTAGPDPVPKIADFGLSRVEPNPAAGSAAGSQGVVVGTRMYLPPEAAEPFAVRHPAQDDVFAVGVLWYQLLAGKLERPPYDFADRLLEAGADARSVRLLSRCLAHPSRRFKDAGELSAALDEEAPPGPGEWDVPDGGFDVAPLAREYLDRLAR
jgi:hypothetical protein